jgi:phosphate-selective porin
MRQPAMTAVRSVSVGLAAALLWLSAGARAETSPDAPANSPGSLIWQTPGGGLVVSPGGRLQVDGAFFPRQSPKSGAYLRRAIGELRGWAGGWFYFDLGGDFAPAPPPGTDVAPSVLPAADDFLAFAPMGDALIVQAGQFDVPFTLENRTSDAETTFIERSMAARSLGAPRNKDVGAMVHGLLWNRRVYYSAGVFNGEGPSFRNIDNKADAIGRVVFTPLADSPGTWRGIALGGSAWHGDHLLGPEAPVQATPGGVVFFEPHWAGSPGSPAFSLREQGTIQAFAGELSVPIGARFGMRGELVWKKQNLVEAAVVANGLTPVGSATLSGIAAYGDVWYWVLGDQRLRPPAGYELPVRLGPPAAPPMENALMIALRGEILKEDLNSDMPSLGDPGIATTRVVSGTAGVNYWRGSLVRVSANYVLNYWSGTSETILTLMASGHLEHEVLVRFALSL